MSKGKFANDLAEMAYTDALDSTAAEVGTTSHLGWAGWIDIEEGEAVPDGGRFDTIILIVTEDPQGFVDVDEYSDESSATDAWILLIDELEPDEEECDCDGDEGERCEVCSLDGLAGPQSLRRLLSF